MNRQSQCVHCRRRFIPNPRVKAQRFCATKACQQARKAAWQRAKMGTDPDYHANQRDAHRTWHQQHSDYWRAYRLTHPTSRERTRLLQTHRDQKRRATRLAKMDASGTVTFVTPGLYHVIPVTGEHLAKMDTLSQKCHIIPMT